MWAVGYRWTVWATPTWGGSTHSANFPATAGSVQPAKNGGYDAFLTALNPTGTGALYLSFLGGNDADFAVGVAADATGAASVTDYMASADFPVTPDAFQSSLAGMFWPRSIPRRLRCRFPARGSGYETGYAVALDNAGRAYVARTSVSADLPTTAVGAQRDFAGPAEAFLLRTVALNRTPSPDTPTLAAGSGSAQTFTFSFSDPNGYQDLNVLNVLINDFLDGRRACYLAYVRSLNVLYLVNDTGDGLLPGLVLNGAGSISNGQCTGYGAGSSASGNGTTLSLTLNLAFSASFAGNCILYLAARDVAERNSGWQAKGRRRVP